MADEKKLLGVIGICRGAGKAIIGVPMICEHLRSLKSADAQDVIVIEASDTSENTGKKISDKCAYYKVQHYKIGSDCLSLGGAVGKGAVAAVAITDKNLCCAVKKQLDSIGIESAR